MHAIRRKNISGLICSYPTHSITRTSDSSTGGLSPFRLKSISTSIPTLHCDQMETVCTQKVKNLCELSRAVTQGTNSRLDENIVDPRQAPLTIQGRAESLGA
jgi:hypothetical protein